LPAGLELLAPFRDLKRWAVLAVRRRKKRLG
jgi:hypothetical protein